MKFSDIKQHYRCQYRVNVAWRNLESYFDTLRSYGDGIEFQPIFQRSLVWTDLQKTRYLEYRLQRGPSAGELSFNCKSWDDFTTKYPVQLVDGQQRLNAVQQFLRGEVRAFGLLIHEFDQDFNKFHGPDFYIHINNLRTDAEVLEWYLQINSYGTPHTPHEIARVQKMLDRERAANA